MSSYTAADMNAAIRRVGWRFLAPLGLEPPDSYVAYAFVAAVLGWASVRLRLKIWERRHPRLPPEVWAAEMARWN
jgi:hypothetical protein